VTWMRAGEKRVLRGDASRIGGEMEKAQDIANRRREQRQRGCRCGYVYFGNAAMTYAHQRKYTVSLVGQGRLPSDSESERFRQVHYRETSLAWTD